MRTLLVAALVCACLAVGVVVYAETTATAVICTEVTDRAPVGAAEKFPATVGRLMCFSEVKGATGKVVHVWLHGDKEMASVELNIGGDRWRTWSSKNIMPDWKGAWKVEVRDEAGAVLATAAFTIE
jgi:hypothetical protein